MSLSTIPSSSAVVTRASDPPDPISPDLLLLHFVSLPGRLECLYPGALPVLTNAPAGRRFCWRCGRWRQETGFRSANDACADCRWAPYRRRHAALLHRKEACDAQVS
jgi:hypothetical protein